MGFLKRIFSRRGRSKKTDNARPVITHPFHAATMSSPHLGVIDEDGEASASRLLRSSSAHFHVVHEASYSDLPPMPHPINSVVNTPGASTASLASTATSLNRGTYSVRVTGRHKHSASQSSTAPSEVERYSERDNDTGQLLRLRSDPSVASLLDLYDMHGRVSTDAFHNSPVKAGRAVKQAATTNDGRAQINRNGSTLRQLLGDPSETTVDSFEGDISWAERFLGESDITSTMTSLDLVNSTHSIHDPSHHHNDNTSTASHDNSTFTDLPGFSSLEVELSSDIDMTEMIQDATPIRPPARFSTFSTKTPRRASEIFKFLTDSDSQETPVAGTRTKASEERSLPDLPGSAFSSPSSDTHDPDHDSPTSDSSVYSSSIHDSPHTPTSPAIPIPPEHDITQSGMHKDMPVDDDPFETSQRVSPLPPPSPRSFRSHHADPSKRHTADSFANTSLAIEALEGGAKLHQVQKVRVIMIAPTKVIVTEPTPNGNDMVDPPTRIPRGPRGQPKRTPGTFTQHRPMLVERSNSGNLGSSRRGNHTAIPVPKKKKKVHYRTPSFGSTTSSIADSEISGPMKLGGSRLPRRSSGSSMRGESEKENVLRAHVELPATPLRSHSALSRSAITPSTFFSHPTGETPSPNSSTEKALSPLGRRLMMDVRQQRMNARDVEKSKGGRAKLV